MDVCKAKSRSSRDVTRLKQNIWDRACKLVLHRVDPFGTYPGPIDSGVNYFVLMLEQLGAKTEFSCSGHPDCPNQFYIVFRATITLAEKIRACGFFAVELEGKKCWSLRTRNIKDDKERQDFLRLAATQWEQKLGPLTAIPNDDI